MIEREFRVGDKVTCNMYGLGEVTSVREKCVIVRFLNGHEEDYSLDGKCYDIGKRTLFILPQQKPTKQQIKEKFKQLLDEVEEVEFKHKEKNYYVELEYLHDKEEYCFSFHSYIYVENLYTKYISRLDATRIVEKMNKFVKGE